MPQRQRHDTAFPLALVLLEIVQNCIRDEEKRDCFDAFYDACMAALVAYDTHREREQDRLKPSSN